MAFRHSLHYLGFVFGRRLVRDDSGMGDRHHHAFISHITCFIISLDWPRRTHLKGIKGDATTTVRLYIKALKETLPF